MGTYDIGNIRIWFNGNITHVIAIAWESYIFSSCSYRYGIIIYHYGYLHTAIQLCSIILESKCTLISRNSIEFPSEWIGFNLFVPGFRRLILVAGLKWKIQILAAGIVWSFRFFIDINNGRNSLGKCTFLASYCVMNCYMNSPLTKPRYELLINSTPCLIAFGGLVIVHRNVPALKSSDTSID